MNTLKRVPNFLSVDQNADGTATGAGKEARHRDLSSAQGLKGTTDIPGLGQNRGADQCHQRPSAPHKGATHPLSHQSPSNHLPQGARNHKGPTPFGRGPAADQQQVLNGRQGSIEPPTPP